MLQVSKTGADKPAVNAAAAGAISEERQEIPDEPAATATAGRAQVGRDMPVFVQLGLKLGAI